MEALVPHVKYLYYFIFNIFSQKEQQNERIALIKSKEIYW